MQPHNSPARRLFGRRRHTPYHGADRRFARGEPYFGLDRRRSLPDPVRLAPRQPAKPSAIPHELEATAALSPADIARRAEQIFHQSGDLPGRDLDNWLAAEAALRREARQAALERHSQALAQWQQMLDHDGLDHADVQDERLWVSRLDRG